LKHGWPVARADAYPEVFHKERGLSLRPPLAWGLELMEGCLRAVPEFVARHPQGDPAREEMTVPVSSGSLKPVLSWVTDEVERMDTQGFFISLFVGTLVVAGWSSPRKVDTELRGS
jgi:hypothetical protein